MTAAVQSAAAAGAATIAWRFDPWRERPRVAVCATLAGLGLCGLVAWARLPFVLAAALCVACLASLAPAIAAAECRLDAEGVARRGPLGWERRPWSAVRRIEHVRGGVLVSPFARRHWLDGTRAMLLPMPAAQRGALSAACIALRDAHAA